MVGQSGEMVAIGKDGEPALRPRLSSANLNGLSSIDDLTAWAVGDDGLILHTTDGGHAWAPQASLVTEHLWSVSFASHVRGAAAGAHGTLLWTDDGGVHWQLVGVGLDLSLRAVRLSSHSGAAVAVGDRGTVLWSKDGGRSFSVLPQLAAESLYAVDIADDGSFAVAVGSSGAAYQITEAGARPLPWDSQGRTLHGVRLLPDQESAIAVGERGLLLRGWFIRGAATLLSSKTGVDLLAIAVSERGDVVAVGKAGVAISSPDGERFEVMPTPTTSDLRAVDAPAEP